MIKSALKIYKNNIWEVFALLGFVSIGLLIGLVILIPNANSLFINSLGKIGSAISNQGATLDLTRFLTELENRMNHLDWANPIRSIRILFNNNGLFNMIVDSLHACGVSETIIKNINNTVHDVVRNLLFSSVDIILILVAITGATSFVGYIFVRIIIQARATSNHNILRFILAFIISLIIIGGTFALIILCLLSLTGANLYLSLVAVFIMLLLLSLISSILIYREKGVRILDLFNFKSIGLLLLSSLIIVAISGVAIILVFIFSDFIALYIALPLLIVTNIVIENIAIKYVTNFNPID